MFLKEKKFPLHEQYSEEQYSLQLWEPSSSPDGFWSQSPGLWLFRFTQTDKCWLKLEAKFPEHQSDVALGLTVLQLTGESPQPEAIRLGSAGSSPLVTRTWSRVWQSPFRNPNTPAAGARDPRAGWELQLGVPLLSSVHSWSVLSTTQTRLHKRKGKALNARNSH